MTRIIGKAWKILVPGEASTGRGGSLACIQASCSAVKGVGKLSSQLATKTSKQVGANCTGVNSNQTTLASTHKLLAANPLHVYHSA